MTDGSGRRSGRHRRSSPFRVTAFGVFGAAFMLLLAAVAAVALAQFRANRLAPWLTIGFSGGAVVCTVAAVTLRRRP